MIFVVIACLLMLMLIWLLLSPIIINVDTRIPVLELKWKNIGTVSLLFNNEKWLLKFRILFFRKIQSLSSLTGSKASSKKKNTDHPKTIKKSHFTIRQVRAIFRVLESCKTRRLNISLDTGDYALNGNLCALYAFPAVARHITINFENKNYVLLQVSNSPLRMLLAYLNIHFFTL